MFTNESPDIVAILEKRPQKAFPIISISEVDQRIDEPNVFKFDCNSYNSYLRHHIPGARHIGLIYSILELPPCRESILVFYSKNAKCKAVSKAAKRAYEEGYKNIFIMRAGITGWILLNKPTVGRKVEAA